MMRFQLALLLSVVLAYGAGTHAQNSGGSSGTSGASTSGTSGTGSSSSSPVTVPGSPNTGTTSAPTNKSDDASKSESAAKAAQGASSQNAIAALTLPMSADKKWNVYLGVDYYGDFKKESDKYQEFGLSYYYQLPASLLFVSTAYVAPTTFQAPSPERYQLQDTSVGWMNPNFKKIGIANMDLITAVTLPTNEFSRIRGMVGQAFGALDTKFSFAKSGLFIVRAGAQVSHYTYETADVFGTTPNSPYALITRGLIRYNFARKLMLQGLYQFSPTWDYNGNRYLNQSASASAIYYLNSQITASVGWSWADQYLTNNSLFDFAASQWTAGLSVGI